ncbi:hypothetical protein Pmani_016554 [Petrolisthes manimaculis]|uniref:Uncharacterized protein n=1 Tax=Petrolisthes manimaculis TaxID=1843537 RepID=A0AAE1PNN8_9EUCA|nr:hypothetical protein Pmani_016554 [Petrolisthes manimaculis]
MEEEEEEEEENEEEEDEEENEEQELMLQATSLVQAATQLTSNCPFVWRGPILASPARVLTSAGWLNCVPALVVLRTGCGVNC